MLMIRVCTWELLEISVTWNLQSARAKVENEKSNIIDVFRSHCATTTGSAIRLKFNVCTYDAMINIGKDFLPWNTKQRNTYA